MTNSRLFALWNIILFRFNEYKRIFTYFRRLEPTYVHMTSLTDSQFESKYGFTKNDHIAMKGINPKEKNANR